MSLDIAKKLKIRVIYIIFLLCTDNRFIKNRYQPVAITQLCWRKMGQFTLGVVIWTVKSAMVHVAKFSYPHLSITIQRLSWGKPNRGVMPRKSTHPCPVRVPGVQISSKKKRAVISALRIVPIRILEWTEGAIEWSRLSKSVADAITL